MENNDITNYIYIDSAILQSKIELLKQEREKINQTLGNVKKDSLGMINYWSGNTGEEAYNILNNYTRKFKEIIDSIDSKINFLESVLYAYSKIDELLNEKLEKNLNIKAY